jgi:hypothetical protein
MSYGNPERRVDMHYVSCIDDKCTVVHSPGVWPICKRATFPCGGALADSAGSRFCGGSDGNSGAAATITRVALTAAGGSVQMDGARFPLVSARPELS